VCRVSFKTPKALSRQASLFGRRNGDQVEVREQSAECSYRLRRRRSATDALETIRLTSGRGHRCVVKIDIHRCSDSIDHEKLMRLVERRVSDRWVRKPVSWYAR
jgi:retron-type reverse transcriptase